MTDTAEHYKALWDAKLKAHKWILCTDAAAAFTPFIPIFGEIGAPRPLILAGSEGTGGLPDPEDCEIVLLGTGAETMLGGIREFQAALRELPQDALDRIDAWDPDGEAIVMQTFLDTKYPVAGRRSYGARPEEWLALEDKMVIDAVWDAAGVARAPIEIVAANAEDLVAASHRIDAGAGVVWTADNKEGWHGGAEYSRHVADPDHADEAIEFMAWHAGRVRVMPFLEGVPCAIHGLVFPNAVATFRPAEMVVFREATSNKFRYASCSTSWDPPIERREEMRDLARTVGAHLRDEHGFRGMFTMDGVLTADGFRPTELNPRYGAGIGTVGRASGMPLLGISRMLIEGETDGLDPVEIERIVTDTADESRSLGGFAITKVRVDENQELRVVWDGDEVREAASDEEANATLNRGPAPLGSMTRFVLDTDAIPVGAMAAPIVAQGLAFADERWGLGLGELVSATPATGMSA
jgi:hypothetical protein